MKAEIQDQFCIALMPENDEEHSALQNMIDRQGSLPRGPVEPLVYWGDVRMDGRETVGFKINYHHAPAASMRVRILEAVDRFMRNILWPATPKSAPEVK